MATKKTQNIERARNQVLQVLAELTPDNGGILILDTETTGMSGADEVIELALHTLDGKEVYCELYKTEVPINPHAQKVHGIRRVDLIGKRAFVDCQEEILDTITGNIIIGWNINTFDKRMLTQTAVNNGADPMVGDYVADNYLDLMEVMRDFTGTKMKQSQALAQLGIEDKATEHRAGGDCVNLAQIFIKLSELLTETL